MKTHRNWQWSPLAFGVLFAASATADEPRSADSSATATVSSKAEAPRAHDGSSATARGGADWSEHPLQTALRYATSTNRYVHRHIRDYTCLLVKRERIDGELQERQFLDARVRMGQTEDGRKLPFSVFLDYLAPAKIKGRKVLYVAGQNENKMLVHNGGKRFNYVTMRIDPRSEAAMRETLVPISEIGFENVTHTFVRLIQENIHRDPTASNTQVTFYKNARVNDRLCTRVSVVHPQPDPELEFADVEVYVDDALHVPIRIEAYDWPKRVGDPKPLRFEYTYEDLRLNVGLTDADFRPALLQPAPVTAQR